MQILNDGLCVILFSETDYLGVTTNEREERGTNIGQLIVLLLVSHTLTDLETEYLMENNRLLFASFNDSNKTEEMNKKKRKNLKIENKKNTKIHMFIFEPLADGHSSFIYILCFILSIHFFFVWENMKLHFCNLQNDLYASCAEHTRLRNIVCGNIKRYIRL